jgi:hypothetical protein
METGLSRYESEHDDISPDIQSFIDASKEKNGSRKIYGMDTEPYNAYKFQKILNGSILKSSKGKEEKQDCWRATLITRLKTYKKSGDFSDNGHDGPVISVTLDMVDALRLVTLLETLK